MKIERGDKPSILIGRRVFLGQIIGAACAWVFWIGENFFGWEVPAAMVTEASVLLVGISQVIAVNVWGVTTKEDE